MQFTTLLLVSSTLLTTTTLAQKFQTSPKRGLVFVNNPAHVDDNKQWPPPLTDLTWYYNYQVRPSPVYANVPQSTFEFVPMLWSPTSTFKDEIQTQINNGLNITHVLGYNEPDGTGSTGGSAVSPQVAAVNWLAQIQPLKKMGIKLGGPAVTGSQRGIQWLEDFFSACSDLGTNCTVDFLPLHWYGNFEGLASFLGQVSATYPNTTLWVTEYALAHQPLKASQDFFKTSAEYMDRIDYIGRYSYFGSFRSDISNVGANAAMLDSKGKLTDIGSWYLGEAATGNIPSAAGRESIKSRAAFVATVLVGLWVL